MHCADAIFVLLLHQFGVVLLPLLLLIELKVDSAERDAHYARYEGTRAADVSEEHRRYCLGSEVAREPGLGGGGGGRVTGVEFKVSILLPLTTFREGCVFVDLASLAR